MPASLVNHYYSGQGSFYVGERDVNGRPKGLRRMGNIPTAEISIEVTKFEHKESESGQRAVDFSLVQEKNGTFSLTLENLTLAQLADAFWGKTVNVVEAEYTESVQVWEDARTPLAHPNIQLTGTAPDEIPTIEVTDGDDVTPTVYTLNDDYWVDAVNGVIWLNPDGAIADGETVEVTYTTAGYDSLIAFTETSMERFIRFEGINTVDNSRVIVEMYRCQIDPLQNYGLINEELGSVTLNGNLLYDGAQPGESKFFRQINLAAPA